MTLKNRSIPRDDKGKFTDKPGISESKTKSKTLKDVKIISSPDNSGLYHITTKTVGKYKGNRKQYFRKVKNWYNENLKNKTITNEILGEITFSAKGIKETLYRNRKVPKNLKYFPAVLGILKHSKDITPEKIKHYKPGAIGAFKIKGKSVTEKTKDGIRKIKIIVIKYSNKIEFYTFDARYKA